MTTASAVPTLIDALVAVGQAAFPSATSPVIVIDGPGNTAQDLGQFLFIGCPDPDSADAADSATSDQIWPYTDHVFRRETITVSCGALAWTGDTETGSMKTVRDQVYAILQAFTNAIVADPSLTGAVLMVTGASNLALKQQSDDQGLIAYLSFDITAMQDLT